MARTKYALGKQSGKAPRSQPPQKGKAAGAKAKAKFKAAKQIVPKIQKPHRYHPGTVALRQIRKFQRGSELLIGKLPHQRLVREIAQEYKSDVRFQATAIMCLQDACEDYLVRRMRKGLMLALHRGRQTLLCKDVAMVKQLETDV